MSEDEIITGTGDPFDPEDIRQAEHVELTEMATREQRRVDKMEMRRMAYHAVFVSGGATPEQRTLVLQDLAWFCRAETSTFATDARDHALLEGRREVWLRINAHATKTTRQLLDIYDPKGT